jgi:hypothetical protein
MQIGQAQAPGKIAEPIPLESTSSAKQSLYQPLVQARLEELGGVAPEPEPTSPIPVDPAEPDATDRQAFLRAVLGDKPYEKTYKLFNDGLEVTLVDRAAKATEKLYEDLRKQEAAEKLSDQDWNTWETRYILASTLRKVRFKGATVKEYDVPADLKGRALELLEFSKPVYLALVSASRLFEQQVQIMTERAGDVGFWKADGSGSPSKPS